MTNIAALQRLGQKRPSPEQPAQLGHELLDAGLLKVPSTSEVPGLRSIVRDSWERSMGFRANPDAPEAPLAMDRAELEEYRRSHPLATIMPVIHKLLIQPSHDSGLLVAVGDDVGRLLWVDGDPVLQRRAEGMMFVAGANWSEASVGTSAPGTALTLNRSVQIRGEEHYKRSVHPWSCTAVPIHDPDSGALLGVVDITGTEIAVAPHTLSLVEATVAAAQAQLQIERLQAAAMLSGSRGSSSRLSSTMLSPKRRSLAGTSVAASAGGSTAGTAEKSHSTASTLYRNSLQLLGRDQALLSIDGRSVTLSARHSEIVALLASHPAGLTAEELTAQLYAREGSTVNLRAEMVRLRSVLKQLSPDAVPESRPYRLPVDLLPDSTQVLKCIQRGAHRIALNIYRGEVLPRSEAPGIVELRHKVAAQLREAVLSDGNADCLLQYAQLAEASDDSEVRMTALKLLPPRSPRRAVVVAELEKIDADLRQ
ncbi:GAF domain-containing protein [Pseudarthrobacter sp. J1738]|uniref:helix-turn-helix domain-containing protein n=1 Tax=Pseudarthrobacter sp. J1738 TaxID=3420446 RepID=UPI003D2C492A